ncbi:hypothetical protein JVT61DRAFT_5459 [Boletus reticuloceps]|uniref:Uncharacterized protein n=1 Tax=Boletus reticuloceps TaxID=495285 RepID=A0A8I2Z1N0_9AGAM|nr:hypothetical protein JVT61DRAFT_5459 [Boletus reticuloceps]
MTEFAFISASVETVPASQYLASEPRGEHEASDVVDQDPNAQVHPDIDPHVEPPLDGTPKDADANLRDPTQEDVFTEPRPASITEVSKKGESASSKRTSLASKDKSTVLAKSVSGKANSSTPADKKALNSATLGAGNAKAASLGKTPTPSSPLSKSAAPSAAKKPTTTTSTNSTKTTTMASSRGSTSGPPPPSRRSSMLPPRASSATGAPPAPKSRTSTLLASLTSSTSSRSPPAEVNATSRQSVVSPVPSVASLKSNATGGATVPSALLSRPRASISEAVKRTPSSSRQSLPPAAAQPLQRPPMRPMGSVSSIREIRDDGRVLEDLQEKLREATENLSAKSDAVATLEIKILRLQASLDEALVNVKTKASSIEQLQISKQSSDAEISGLKVRVQQVQAEHSHDLAALNSVSDELKNANKFMASQAENFKALEAQVETLQADVAAAQENFESLRSSSDQSSAESAAAAQMEREAFLRAKADVETVTAELNDLRAAHDRARQEAAARSRRITAARSELKAEREGSAAKISELEVEILELKESQENAEDEHKRILGRLQKLEAELAEAVTATQQALRDAEARDAESTQKAADVALLHANEVQLIESNVANAVSEVEVLNTELAAAHAAHDETKAAAQASADAHEQEMDEAEQSYLSKHIELSEEIKRLTAELEGLEAKYSAKVDDVRAEHDQLLQEAFERAKNDAGEVHGQDLQALRAESQATIEQLRAAHQSTVNDLRLEHEAALESQDDLSKAKAALDTSRAEGENLKAQLEDARANFIAASTNDDQATDIERLTKEIANLRDENVMLNDVLAITKESLSETSANHSKELEEAARIRVEEVMRLRSIHEGEISTVAAQKSELALSLSDLEGEIATLRAQLAAVEPAVVPRSNGAVHASATTVTREELQKVHEAHNLKMHDLQAGHERAAEGQDVARKSMEIQYLEQEQEESQDSITRYVKVFGLQSLFGVVIALAVIFDFI